MVFFINWYLSLRVAFDRFRSSPLLWFENVLNVYVFSVSVYQYRSMYRDNLLVAHSLANPLTQCSDILEGNEVAFLLDDDGSLLIGGLKWLTLRIPSLLPWPHSVGEYGCTILFVFVC